jgi:acylphosphatase
MVPRIAFTVRGRVQGVGFRAATAYEARQLHLGGYVENHRTMDDRVDGEAEGPPEALRKFRAWLQHGPRLARVTEVLVSEVSERGETEFVIR